MIAHTGVSALGMEACFVPTEQLHHCMRERSSNRVRIHAMEGVVVEIVCIQLREAISGDFSNEWACGRMQIAHGAVRGDGMDASATNVPVWIELICFYMDSIPNLRKGDMVRSGDLTGINWTMREKVAWAA
jgi:hypothetical protein